MGDDDGQTLAFTHHKRTAGTIVFLCAVALAAVVLMDKEAMMGGGEDESTAFVSEPDVRLSDKDEKDTVLLSVARPAAWQHELEHAEHSLVNPAAHKEAAAPVPQIQASGTKHITERKLLKNAEAFLNYDRHVKQHIDDEGDARTIVYGSKHSRHTQQQRRNFEAVWKDDSLRAARHLVYGTSVKVHHDSPAKKHRNAHKATKTAAKAVVKKVAKMPRKDEHRTNKVATKPAGATVINTKAKRKGKLTMRKKAQAGRKKVGRKKAAKKKPTKKKPAKKKPAKKKPAKISQQTARQTLLFKKMSAAAKRAVATALHHYHGHNAIQVAKKAAQVGCTEAMKQEARILATRMAVAADKNGLNEREAIGRAIATVLKVARLISPVIIRSVVQRTVNTQGTRASFTHLNDGDARIAKLQAKARK